MKHNIQQEINNNNYIVLETNSEGKVDLGKLNDINACSIDSKSFSLEKLPKHVYLQRINILEKQKLILPFVSKENNKITLMKLSNEKPSENLTDLL